MSALKPEEKMILFRVYALIVLIAIVVAFSLTFEQWLWLIAVGLFITLIFLFFHICDKLYTKYVKNLSGEATNDPVMAIIQERIQKRMLRYAERTDKTPDEFHEMLERDAKFMKDNGFVIAAFQKVYLTLMFSVAIGYITTHLISKIFKYPYLSMAELIGVISGILCFIGISTFFLVRFFKKVRKGIKESHKNDIIIRK